MTPDEAGLAVVALGDALRGFFLNAGVPDWDVDDCLSETWLRVARSLDDYDPANGDFGPWVMGCAKNALGDWKRVDTYGRERTKIVFVPGDALRFLAIANELEDRILEKIDRERLSRAVRRVVGMLTPRQERIITRHYFDGVEYVTIGEEEGRTANAVKLAARYGLERLKRTIESLIDPSIPPPRVANGRGNE